MVPHRSLFPPSSMSERCNMLSRPHPGPEFQEPSSKTHGVPRFLGYGAGERTGVLEPMSDKSLRTPNQRTESLGWDGETAGAAARTPGRAQRPGRPSSPQHPTGGRPPAAKSSLPRAAPRGLGPGLRRSPPHPARDRYRARAAPNARPRRPPARRSPSWGPGSQPGAPAASPQLGAPTPPPSLSLARPPRRNWARVASSGRNSALREAPAETEARMVPSGPPLGGVWGRPQNPPPRQTTPTTSPRSTQHRSRPRHAHPRATQPATPPSPCAFSKAL